MSINVTCYVLAFESPRFINGCAYADVLSLMQILKRHNFKGICSASPDSGEIVTQRPLQALHLLSDNMPFQGTWFFLFMGFYLNIRFSLSCSLKEGIALNSGLSPAISRRWPHLAGGFT